MTLKNVGSFIVFTKQECSVMSYCLWPPWAAAHQASLPWNIPSKNIPGVGCHSYSRRFSWPRDWTCISCIGRWILYHSPTREALCSFYSTEGYSWENSSFFRTRLDFFKTSYKLPFGFNTPITLHIESYLPSTLPQIKWSIRQRFISYKE